MVAFASDRNDRSLGAVGWLLIALMLQLGVSRWHASDVISVDYFTLWAVPATLAEVPDRNIYSQDNQRAMATAAGVLAASTPQSQALQLATHVSNQIYGGRIDATGSPLAYALVGLTSTGRYDDDLDRFTVASFAAFLLSMTLMCRLLGYSLSGTAIAAAAYSLCFSPLLAELRVVNVNQLQLLALSLFLWLNQKQYPVIAGAVLGMGIMFKPNIAMVLLVAVIVAIAGRRFRATARMFGGTAVGMAIGFGAGAAYFGTVDVWRLFIESVGRTLEISYPLTQGNFGLATLIATLSGAEVSAMLAIAVLTIVVVVLGRSRPRADEDEPPALDEHFLTVGIGCAGMLLASRLVWLHYYVLLIPLSLYLLRPSGLAPYRRIGPVASGLALLLLSPAVQALTDSPVYISVLINIATVLLFSAGLYAWWTIRRPLALQQRRGQERRVGRR